MKDKEMIIRLRLEHDYEFATKCLLILYSKQNETEQFTGQTQDENGVGFTKSDSIDCSRLAKYLLDDNQLIEGTIATIFLHKVLPKYAKQLSGYLTDEEVEE